MIRFEMLVIHLTATLQRDISTKWDRLKLAEIQSDLLEDLDNKTFAGQKNDQKTSSLRLLATLVLALVALVMVLILILVLATLVRSSLAGTGLSGQLFC